MSTKIEWCVCGSEATVMEEGKEYLVACTRPYCWFGPSSVSHAKAVRDWNKLMRAGWRKKGERHVKNSD